MVSAILFGRAPAVRGVPRRNPVHGLRRLIRVKNLFPRCRARQQVKHILVVLSCLVPVVGLVTLVVMNAKVIAVLREAGYDIGLFGVKSSGMRD